jgi:hypothetical protein
MLFCLQQDPEDFFGIVFRESSGEARREIKKMAIGGDIQPT